MMKQMLAILPSVNAVLIFTSGLFIIAGVRSIRRGDQLGHQRAMLVATSLATAFLVFYVTRISLGGMTPFQGPTPIRWIYLAILISHVSLAAFQAPMVLVTLYRASRGLFPSHKALGRITYPIWIYVSFTGVLVYGLLHFPYPPS